MTTDPDAEATADPATEVTADPATAVTASSDTAVAVGPDAEATADPEGGATARPDGEATADPEGGATAGLDVEATAGPGTAVTAESGRGFGDDAARGAESGPPSGPLAAAGSAPSSESATIAAAAAAAATSTAAPPRETIRALGTGSSPGDRIPPAGGGTPARLPAPAQVPPWRTVLWTTLRLWSGRTAGRLGRPRRWLAAVAVLAVVAVAVLAQVALSHRQPGGVTGTGSGTGQRSAGQSAPSVDGAAVRGQAATWIVRAVSGSAIVACDPAMCAALQAAGLPPTSLLVLRPSAQDPLGADLIVATPALRNQFLGRLTSVYAPLTVARFGTGVTRIDVRVIAPNGSAEYQRALAADLAARRGAASQLLGTQRIGVTPAARAALTAGQVDPRLLGLLPPLAAVHPLRVMAFADRAPGADAAVPYVAVQLATTGTGAGISPARYRSWLLGFLSRQQVPYRPAQVTVSPGAGPTVLIRFGLPSPVGSLGKG